LCRAQKRDLTLVPDSKFKEIAGIYTAVIDAASKISQFETAKSKPPSQVKRSSTRGKSTWEFAKGYLNLGDRIGAGLMETEIVYIEGEETNPQIYIEFTQMRGPLFVGNLDTILKRLERMPYQLIWEANKGLLLLIAQYFGFLFTMFFPGVGYFGAFLKMGFSGVLRQVAAQEVLDTVLSQLSKQGTSSSLGLSPDALAVLSVLVSGRKAPAKLAQVAKREALKAESDARLLEGKSTPLLREGGQEVSQLEERKLGDIGAGRPLDDVQNRGVSKPTKQIQAIEDRAVETEAAGSVEAKGTGAKKTTFREAEDAEPRAETVSAKTSRQPKGPAKKGREIEAEGGEDPKFGKGTGAKTARGTADTGFGPVSRGTQTRGLGSGVSKSPQGYLSVGVQNSKQYKALVGDGLIKVKPKKVKLGTSGWAKFQTQVSPEEFELTSPSVSSVRVDGLAVDSGELVALEAKAGFVKDVEKSRHLIFYEGKVEQLTKQLVVVFESRGRLSRIIIPCLSRPAAETYSNIVKQQITPRIREWLKGQKDNRLKQLLSDDLEQLVEKHIDVEWVDWAPKMP
jgi:hypothetical protein